MLFKHFFSKHEMRTFFHSKFYVQSGSMNLPQPVEKKSHHATGNFGVKITSLLLRRGEIYLQFCSKVFTSARDCQIAKQLLMSNASFERLNKNTVKLILLDGSEIHGTGTPPPPPKFTSSLPKNLPGPNRKGLRVFTLPPFFRGFRCWTSRGGYTSYEILFCEWLNRVMTYKLHIDYGM